MNAFSKTAQGMATTLARVYIERYGVGLAKEMMEERDGK